MTHSFMRTFHPFMMRCLVVAIPALLGIAHAQLIDIAGISKYPAPELLSAPLAVQKDAPGDADDTDATKARPESRIRRSPSLVRRDDCSPQPSGTGPVPSPDTAENFLSSQDLADLANNAKSPDGYVAAFTNLHASLSAPSYMGLSTLTSYDPLSCASLCDQASGCQAFNVFAERDPTQSPADSCPNPPSTTNFKCTLWGVGVASTEATNEGQWAGQFHLVIAASNAYNKTAPPAAIANWNGPTELGGAINAPLDAQGRNTYMGYKYHPFTGDQGYDPQACWTDCDQQTKYNAGTKAADGTYQTCVFFDAYVLSKNSIPQGLYCSMYNQTWSRDYGTNYGQTAGSDRYTVSRSYSYAMKDLPNPSTSQPQPKSSSSTTLATSTTTTKATSTPTPSCALRPSLLNWDFEGGVNATASTGSGWQVPNNWQFRTDTTYGGRSDGSWDISATPLLSSGSSAQVYGRATNGGKNSFEAKYSNSGASGFASSSIWQTINTCPGAQHMLSFNYIIDGSYVPSYATLSSMGWQTNGRDSGNSGWYSKSVYFTASANTTNIYFSFTGPAYAAFYVDSVVLSTLNNGYYQSNY